MLSGTPSLLYRPTFQYVFDLPAPKASDAITHLSKHLVSSGIPVTNDSSSATSSNNGWTVRLWGPTRIRAGWPLEIVGPFMEAHDDPRISKMLTSIARLNPDCHYTASFVVNIASQNGWTVDGIQKVAHNFVKFESVIDCLVPERRRGDNGYFRSNRDAVGRGEPNIKVKERILAAKDWDSLRNLLNPSTASRKPFKLYLPTGASGYIQFSQHSPTYNTQKSTSWIRLLLRFVTVSIMMRFPPAFLQEREQQYDPHTGRNAWKEKFFFEVMGDAALQRWCSERMAELTKQGVGKGGGGAGGYVPSNIQHNAGLPPSLPHQVGIGAGGGAGYNSSYSRPTNTRTTTLHNNTDWSTTSLLPQHPPTLEPRHTKSTLHTLLRQQ
ncbi:hypothetical protein HDV00_002960 [Rhizophlyctis rosea]|nr:hypothetical protein HDV00_002960 [Rhizophlyctis rosea]